MNDKIRRFTTQLSEAAPLAPELEGRTMSERGFSPATTLTATRIGLAVATVAVLGFVAATVSGGDDRSSVVPASGDSDAVAALSGAIEAALPPGFRLMVVERRDDNSGHAIAVNDRLEVLDIEINPTPPSQQNTTDSVPTASSYDVPVSGTEPPCIAPVSTPDASECLQYANEGTEATTPPTTENTSKQPTCYTFGFVQESSSPTTSIPCSLEKLESQEIAVSNQCTVYVSSLPDVPPSISECPQVTVIVDETIASTVPIVGSSPDTGPADGESGSETPTTFTQWTGEESFMDDAFGPDVNGNRSPFAHASTRNNGVFVGATLFAINRTVDLPTFVDELSHNVVTIGDLRTVIDSLPEALAPVGMNAATPTQSQFPEGQWTSRGVTTGSFSVLLGQHTEDGAVVVQMSFPGSLETSGNDGDIFWHATTIDGRVSIVLFQRGDRDAMTDEDAAALTRKMAMGWVDESASALDERSGVVTDFTIADDAGPATPEIENPVETTVWGGF